MANIFVKSGSGVVPYTFKAWTTGERMVLAVTDVSTNASVAKRWVWECTTAGTSTTTPVWPATITQDVTTVTADGVIWTARRPGYSTGNTIDWSFATIYMAYAASATAVGDVVYVDSMHSENSSSSITYSFAGTHTSPNRVICVDSASTVFTQPTTGAGISTSSGSSLTINGSVYFYGVNFTIGSTSSAASLNVANGSGNYQCFERCNVVFQTTSTSSRLNLGNTTGDSRYAKFVEVGVYLNNAAQSIQFRNVKFEWYKGTVSAVAAPTAVFTSSIYSSSLDVSSVDFSNLGATFNMVLGSNGSANTFNFSNIHMPIGWSGSWFSGVIDKVESINVSNFQIKNATRNIGSYRRYEFCGNIRDESVITKSLGANNSFANYSLKSTTSADANYIRPLILEPIYRMYPGTQSEISSWVPGTTKTVSIDFLHDSVTSLTNEEIWMEVYAYTATTNTPMTALVSSIKANIFSTPAGYSASNASWTTTGLTNPNAQRMSVSVPFYTKGPVLVKVYIAKPNYTIYIDPKVIIG